MEKKIRNLGAVALFCVIVPEFISSTAINLLLGSAGTVIGCYLFFMLGKVYGEDNLFKINIIQNVIALPVVVLLSLLVANQTTIEQGSVFYAVIGMVILLLLFLAFTNYKLAKHLTSLSQKTNNQYFKFSGLLLLISAYTTPIIVGLIFFAVAFVLFLLGCVLFKEKQNES